MSTAAMTIHERIQDLLARLQDVVVEKEGVQWNALCPAHDDSRRSLSVGIGDDERLILHCHAGCTSAAVMLATGLPLSMLFAGGDSHGHSHGKSKKSKGLGKIVATYDYQSAAGELLYQVVRYEPKDFRQRRPKTPGAIPASDDPAGWTWTVKDEEKVPYRLPSIISAPPGATIYIVEGEKDADGLVNDFGRLATSNPGGAGKWLSTANFTDPFRGRHVVILPDNDDVGRQHAHSVATLLHPVAASLKVLALPHIPNKGDFSDWRKSGGTVEQLDALTVATAPWNPSPIKPVEKHDDPHRLARIIIGDFRRVIYWREEFYVMRYESPRRPADRCYVRIEKAKWKATVSQLIKKEFDRLNVEAIAENPGKTHYCEKVTTQLISNVISALQSMTAMSAEVELGSWLDDTGPAVKRRWINLANGIFKVELSLEGRPLEEFLIPHDHRWFSTNVLPFEFDWDAQSPRFFRYLKTSLEDDAERIALLQEWAGYLLTPDTNQQKFLILEGEGANGKSVYLAAMEALLGQANVSHVPLEIFGQRFQLTSTLGKLANVCADCGEIDAVAEGYLKSFTSGDRMQFDRKGLPAIDVTPTARLMIATNNRPRFSDKSSGIWRRMLLIPFTREIPPEERVAGMDKPDWWAEQKELSGIFNWALEGLQRLRSDGRFTIPEICRTAIEEYRLDINPARSFLVDRYRQAATEDQFINVLEVYEAYSKYCEAYGHRRLAAPTFGKEVFRCFPEVTKVKRGSKAERFWAYGRLEPNSEDTLFDKASF